MQVRNWKFSTNGPFAIERGKLLGKPNLHLYAKYDSWAEICPEIVLTQKKNFLAVSPFLLQRAHIIFVNGRNYKSRDFGVRINSLATGFVTLHKKIFLLS